MERVFRLRWGGFLWKRIWAERSWVCSTVIYPLMASDHEQALRQAKEKATAPLTLVDTDFVTTQAFCEVYEGKTHPFLTACIDEFRMDYTIMLASNTEWVADGMRSLGQSRATQKVLKIG